MAERGSRNTSSDGSSSGRSGAVALRVVTRRRVESSAPEWAPGAAVTGGWRPDVSDGPEWPFEPDAEAAAFLNAPRRTLDFYVAPFGTPPFGNAAGGRPTSAGLRPEPTAGRGGTQWGEAYPAGA